VKLAIFKYIKNLKIMDREIFSKKINHNITEYGFHINVVNQKLTPRYAYSIGLINSCGFELVLAGCMDLLYDDVISIMNNIGNKLLKHDETIDAQFILGQNGLYKLRKIHESWSEIMLLGAKDFFNFDDIPSCQIYPCNDKISFDVPNMDEIFLPNSQPIWSWLTNENNSTFPIDSKVIVNKDILFGAKALEIMRWEENEWEIYSTNSDNLNEHDMRIIPLTTMIGAESTLGRILDLEVGKGLVRKLPSNEWEDWG